MFSKTEKKLHDDNNFNPPPGYYSNNGAFDNKSQNPVIPSFARQQRFEGARTDQNPGPGAYYNDRTEKIKKRIIEQSKRREGYQKPAPESEIKISSIPSIPKKSATRVYQELAPGILILHEEENQNSSIGPGTYNINPNIGHKKTITHKINPEHKKKTPPSEPEIKIPTIAEEIRNQKRMMYKKNLIKSTGNNKNIISPSDLCLEVIILRERLMRSDENPPPGAYYNEKYQSSFKELDPDLLPQYQLMMGKEERFKDNGNTTAEIGPGAYQSIFSAVKNPGGFISKGQRKMHSQKKNIPGPGSYKIDTAKVQPVDPKGNYPPIFGSGGQRFYSADRKNDTTPGPGSYKVDGPRKKKQKYIKVKKNFYQSQFVKPQKHTDTNDDLFSLGGDKAKSYQQSFKEKQKKPKNNHYFTSQVERFKNSEKNVNSIGPGNYDYTNSGFVRESFNKKKDAYTGSKQPRFDDAKVRPNLGPGAYFTGETLKKQ